VVVVLPVTGSVVVAEVEVLAEEVLSVLVVSVLEVSVVAVAVVVSVEVAGRGSTTIADFSYLIANGTTKVVLCLVLSPNSSQTVTFKSCLPLLSGVIFSL